ncbi:unnamed protein product [Clonostachys rosea]|uniref:Major facilitator superfamily (MFS) profile domain-containing protein n=1 Tax=Bionectria ochroleuca TaxID=29856 RepID=A0ABY6TRI1_BIOOC|nr:unnamed protein product [Clonostachys rosea]
MDSGKLPREDVSIKLAQEDALSVQETSTEQILIDPEAEKALLRKIDMRLMPTIWALYLLSYADRTNIGNAKVAGMADDLHLTSNQYSMTLVIFFITYVLFEIPSNLILARTRPSLYIPAIMVAWGVVTCCMSLVQTYEGLLATRIVLGIFEAGFAPGVMFILSSWYKRHEQAKRFTIFYSAAVLSGAFGGIVAGAITGSLNGVHGIRGWRWLFIVEGVATVGCAIIAIPLLLDFPMNTRGFTPAERELAIRRLLADNVTARTEDEAPMAHLEAVRKSLTDWRVWMLAIGYVSLGGSGTMSYFYPTLVQGLGYTSHMAQYMTTPIYAVAFICCLVTGYLNDKFPTIRGLFVAGLVGVACICAVVVCAVYNYVARYVLLVFMASGLLSGNALSLAYASSTFAPMRAEVRAVSLAWVNTVANLSGIFGAYFFPSEDGPKYIMGFALVASLSAVCVIIYGSAHFLIRRYPAHQ